MKELMLSLRVKILNYAYAKLDTRWNYNNVNDPFSRIYYITDGKGYIKHHNKLFNLEKGHLYLIPEYSRAQLSCSSFLHQYYVHFTVEILPNISLFQIFPPLFHIDLKKDIALQLLIKQYFFYSKTNILTTDIALDGLIRILISKFYSQHLFPSNIPLSEFSRFTKILSYMEEHISKSISLEEMASILHLQPTYFSNLFTKTFGTPPIRYFNKKKIEKAMFLLHTTQDPIEKIARKLGFTDTFYFSRLFKKITNLSPSQYRRQNKNIII